MEDGADAPRTLLDKLLGRNKTPREVPAENPKKPVIVESPFTQAAQEHELPGKPFTPGGS